MMASYKAANQQMVGRRVNLFQTANGAKKGNYASETSQSTNVGSGEVVSPLKMLSNNGQNSFQKAERDIYYKQANWN